MTNPSLRLLTKVAPATPIGPEPVKLEAEIIAELDRGPEGERLATAFQRKEHALGALFAQLSIEEARVLHRRLTVPLANDPVAQRFAKLVVDRQRRLLAFLGDARRRHALARGR